MPEDNKKIPEDASAAVEP